MPNQLCRLRVGLPSCSFLRTACFILLMSMCRLPSMCTCSVVLSSSGLATRSLELGSTSRFEGSLELAEDVDRLRVEPRTYEIDGDHIV